MSLLSSIFGGKAEATEPSTVFDKQVDIPEPKPLPKRLPPRESKPETTNKRKRKEKKVEEVKDPEDVPVSEEKEVDDRTVFVGNLPLGVDRRKLAKVFKDCGKIESCRIRSVATTGVKIPEDKAGNQKMVKKVCANTNLVDSKAKSTVHGYVVFADTEAVPKALALNNSEVKHEGVTLRIRVDHANPTFDASRTVFVGNLPYHAEESSLQAHFAKQCGTDVSAVEGVRIVRDKETFQCKGFGYVLFQDTAVVAKALQEANGSQYMKRELRVQVCGRRFKGRQGEPKPEKKQRVFEGKRSTEQSAETNIGALRRIVQKELTEKASPKKRRARGAKTTTKPGVRKAGVSKRQASESKTDKRVKKLQKRIAKGMGKARK